MALLGEEGFMEEEYLNYYTNKGEEVLLSQEVVYIALAVATWTISLEVERHCNRDESGVAVVSVRLRMENPEGQIIAVEGKQTDKLWFT